MVHRAVLLFAVWCGVKAPSPDGMQVFVRTRDSEQTLSLDVRSNATVHSLLQSLETVTQRQYFGKSMVLHQGRELDEKAALSDSGIVPEATVYVETMQVTLDFFLGTSLTGTMSPCDQNDVGPVRVRVPAIDTDFADLIWRELEAANDRATLSNAWTITDFATVNEWYGHVKYPRSSLSS